MARRGRPPNDPAKKKAIGDRVSKRGTTGKRGAKRTVTASKPTIRGTIGPAIEPQADEITTIDARLFRPPAWLNERDRETWREVVPTLQTRRLFADSDVVTFARYCRLLGSYLDLCAASEGRRFVRREKRDKGKGTIEKVSATFRARLEIEKMLLAYEDRFAMSPRERVAILDKLANAAGRVPPQPDQPPPKPQMGDEKVTSRGPVGFLAATPPPKSAQN